MSIEVTEFYDHETGRNYLLLYDRELSYDEARQAVSEIKPNFVLETAKGPVFIVGINSGWNSKPGA
jgi:hypothetical protein